MGSRVAAPSFGGIEPALAIWQAFEGLIEACLYHEVDFLVLAGDTFERPQVPPSDQRRFSVGAHRLYKAEIPIYLIQGNHDPRTDGTLFLQDIAGLHVFDASQASTIKNEKLKLAVHGQSFKPGPVPQNLMLEYPPAVPGYFNLGILHTSLSVEGQAARYAPCTEQDLKLKGYDYWALGHVHKPEVFCHEPWIGFAGNLQARHFRELGLRGANLVWVDQGSVDVEFLPLSRLTFEWLEIKADENLILDAEDNTATTSEARIAEEAGTGPSQSQIFETLAAASARRIDAEVASKAKANTDGKLRTMGRGGDQSPPMVFRLALLGSPSGLAAMSGEEIAFAEAVRAKSFALQSQKAYLKDVKLTIEKNTATIALPFDLDEALLEDALARGDESLSKYQDAMKKRELVPAHLEASAVGNLLRAHLQKAG